MIRQSSSLVNEDWASVVARLGGASALEAGARETGAFVRPRKIRTAVDLLRFTLAYCLGEMGLRLTAAWGAALGLASLSNVALLGRLRNMDGWLARLVGEALSAERPAAAHGRLIRLVDATTVAQAGAKVSGHQRQWRLHGAFDLPTERFGFVELTDGHGGERFDRAPVIAGEIRIGDRIYAQPDRLAQVIAGGGDVLVRAGWNNLRWLDADGQRFDLIATLRAHEAPGVVDQPVWVGRTGRQPPLALRLVALAKPAEAAEAARRRARQAASKKGCQITRETLYAAGWVILVTSLSPEAFSTQDVGALYRVRWRVELAFKRLKSLAGLKQPPAKDPQLAKAHVLAHLLIALLIEPRLRKLSDSPRWAPA
jgi:hypothetical protein